MKTIITFFTLLENRFWVALRDLALSFVFGFLGFALVYASITSSKLAGGKTFNCSFGVVFAIIAVVMLWWWWKGERPTMLMLLRAARSWAILPPDDRVKVLKAHNALMRALKVAEAHAMLSIAHPEDYHTEWQEVKVSESLGEGLSAAIYIRTPLHGQEGESICRYLMIATQDAQQGELTLLCNCLNQRWQQWEGAILKA